MVKKEEAKTRVRIKLKAYDHKVLDKSAAQIIETTKRSGAEVVGPVPLPTHVSKITVNKSPFVYKDTREQFEMRIHKRLVDILNPTQKTIADLTDLNLPAGVDIEVKM